MKRTYYGCLKTSRKELAGMGLTAARFDLLYILWDTPDRTPCTQKSLHRLLGVAKSVTCRMLRSLLEIGLVKREHPVRKAREWLISLTREGRRRIGEAIDYFIRGKRAWKRIERALCPGVPKGEERTESAIWEMCQLEEYLDRLRKRFRARGTLFYPWHPDDFWVDCLLPLTRPRADADMGDPARLKRAAERALSRER